MEVVAGRWYGPMVASTGVFHGNAWALSGERLDAIQWVAAAFQRAEPNTAAMAFFTHHSVSIGAW